MPNAKVCYGQTLTKPYVMYSMILITQYASSLVKACVTILIVSFQHYLILQHLHSDKCRPLTTNSQRLSLTRHLKKAYLITPLSSLTLPDILILSLITETKERRSASEIQDQFSKFKCNSASSNRTNSPEHVNSHGRKMHIQVVKVLMQDCRRNGTALFLFHPLMTVPCVL